MSCQYYLLGFRACDPGRVGLNQSRRWFRDRSLEDESRGWGSGLWRWGQKKPQGEAVSSRVEDHGCSSGLCPAVVPSNRADTQPSKEVQFPSGSWSRWWRIPIVWPDVGAHSASTSETGHQDHRLNSDRTCLAWFTLWDGSPTQAPAHRWDRKKFPCSFSLGVIPSSVRGLLCTLCSGVAPVGSWWTT